MWKLNGAPVIHEDIERMTAILGHRGKDDFGIWVHGSVGLGNQMLWTTPESQLERLPCADSSGDLVITADARIDNREELYAALEIHDRNCTDSGLILAAYKKWAENCPTKLLGDFSFAIFDQRQRRLFCARDHFGVRPFYYHHARSRLLVYGSEIKALLCSRDVPRRLNERRMGEFLSGNWLDNIEATLYSEILRLPAAHFMIVDQGGLTVRKYWELDPFVELSLSSDEEYAEAFRAVFTEAVRARLRSVYPVGSTLSGGLDSSAVVCVARDILQQKNKYTLQSITVAYDATPQCDERKYSGVVAAQGGILAHQVSGDDLNPFADIERVLWHHDEPFWAPYVCLDWGAIYPCAQNNGIRVLLNGLEGDTVVDWGLYWLAELVRAGHWVKASRELSEFSRRSGRSMRGLIRNCILQPLFPGNPLWKMSRFRRTKGILDFAFAQRIGLHETHKQSALPFSGQPKLSRYYHWEALSPGIHQNPLESYNKSAAAFSLELRSPFCDKRLAELCLSFPGDQKLRHGLIKFALRNALRGVLPEQVRLRDFKTSATANYDRILMQFGRPLLDKVILGSSSGLQEFVNMAALRKMYTDFSSGSDRSGRYLIWGAVVLDMWLKKHM
jgi:asparagine synthase (glutamine-hydrolysing)